MWYPASVTVAASSEPVTTEQARQQVRSFFPDPDIDGYLDALVTRARVHVENYCGIRVPSQTIVIKCDCFEDMARLPDAPVQSITSITYLDTDGATQTLATSVYELRADNLEAAVVLKYNQSWPAIQAGSRITLTAVVGYSTAPVDIQHAILLWVADNFDQRENSAAEDWTAFDALLCNHRRNA